MKLLAKHQITLEDSLKMIAADECKTFEIHCRMLTSDGQKYNRYYSDFAEENEDATPSLFVNATDNYGSFWLMINNGEFWQIVDPAGEPL